MMFDEYKKKLEECAKEADYDQEEAHYKADDVLCHIALSTTLTKNQRIELVNIYKSFDKWYA